MSATRDSDGANEISAATDRLLDLVAMWDDMRNSLGSDCLCLLVLDVAADMFERMMHVAYLEYQCETMQPPREDALIGPYCNATEVQRIVRDVLDRLGLTYEELAAGAFHVVSDGDIRTLASWIKKISKGSFKTVSTDRARQLLAYCAVLLDADRSRDQNRIGEVLDCSRTPGLDAAKDFLLRELGNGPCLCEVVIHNAKARGISMASLYRVRDVIGIRSIRDITDPRRKRVFWALPR